MVRIHPGAPFKARKKPVRGSPLTGFFVLRIRAAALPYGCAYLKASTQLQAPAKSHRRAIKRRWKRRGSRNCEAIALALLLVVLKHNGFLNWLCAGGVPGLLIVPMLALSDRLPPKFQPDMVHLPAGGLVLSIG